MLETPHVLVGATGAFHTTFLASDNELIEISRHVQMHFPGPVGSRNPCTPSETKYRRGESIRGWVRWVCKGMVLEV